MINKTCKKCAKCSVLYTKGSFMFWKENRAICSCNQKINESKGSCRFFEAEMYSVNELIKLLDTSIEAIKDLKQIYGTK